MQNTPKPTSFATLSPGAAGLGSVVLARLMDEVRNSVDQQPTAYNRMHNRHNR